MIRIGDYNILKAVRSTSVGVFLEDEEGTEILLPNKYVPDNIKLNEDLKVFCYLDHEERPIATTLTPFIVRDGFAFLEVAQITSIGAFMDWGLEKQLLVPFREQTIRMAQGQRYVVHCHLDEKSFRLVGSAKLEKFLKNEVVDYDVNQEVDLLVTRKTDLGWEAIINNCHKGLLFFSDVYEQLAIGDSCNGYIKSIRDDGKIDLTLSPIGVRVLDVAAKKILEVLQAGNGFLPLHDKSSPETIKAKLQMSKKAFKKGVGVLYKQRKIELTPTGIRLLKQE